MSFELLRTVVNTVSTTDITEHADVVIAWANGYPILAVGLGLCVWFIVKKLIKIAVIVGVCAVVYWFYVNCVA